MSLKQLIRFTNDACLSSSHFSPSSLPLLSRSNHNHNHNPTNTPTAAIEKTLRFLQGISQILAAYATSSHHVSIWLLCRQQFALGRRFLRFGRWVGCLERAWVVYVGIRRGGFCRRGGGIEGWLEMGKWGAMGVYLGCESVGIVSLLHFLF